MFFGFEFRKFVFFRVLVTAAVFLSFFKKINAVFLSALYL